MIWLIGNRGMLGSDIEIELRSQHIPYFATGSEIDIVNKKQLTAFSKQRNYHTIINCSAYTNVDRAEEEADLAHQINHIGVLNIAELAVSSKARLIHISTDYVFDGSKGSEYLESDVQRPINVYGKSKSLGEQAIIKLCDNYSIIRTSWLYGKYGKNFVYTMLNLFRAKDEIFVVDDQIGNPTYSMDLAKAVISVSESKKAVGVLNFSNKGSVSWFHFAETIQRCANLRDDYDSNCRIVPIHATEFPTRAKRPANSRLNTSKIENILAMKIPDWDDALNRFIMELDFREL